ncbi:glycosyltransferase [Vulcanisaeta thermophila]|uniref:glycosyltransferase n=1 Tax=Vulcanisaeta thermophila TaxID=867917 RepID=UPI000852B35B|nr:glycosyltransferase [Vulcanisaeta thermophila]
MDKVLHISLEYPPHRVIGPLAYTIRDLVTQLSRYYEIYLIHPADFDGDYMDGDVRVHAVSDRWFSDVLVYAHYLVSEVSSKAPYIVPRDVVLIHAHDWIPAMVGRVIAKRLRKPLIVSVYTTEPMRSGGSLSLLSLSITDWERYVLSEADHVIAHSRFALESLSRDYGIKASLFNDLSTILSIYRDVIKPRA